MRPDSRVEKPVSDKQEIVEADYNESTHGSDEDDFYTMEDLNSWKIRLWPTWRESSRTSGLGKIQVQIKSGSNFSGSSVQGSEETRRINLRVIQQNWLQIWYGRP